MIEFKLETAAAGSDGTPAVSIIGIGGAGANVLDHIALEGMDGVELISMNCDARSLTSSMAQRKVQLGKNLTQGLGCGGDPELGNDAAVSSMDEIREALGGRRMIFICVGLGGGTGSGAAPVVARLARETGAFVIVFATMPFVFEGRRRTQQAQGALDDIRQYANALVCFENDKMGELVLPKKGVTEAFEVADKIICQSVRAVTTVATQPGLIRIGMDDLVTALRNADSRCLFGFGQAKGEARATEALQAALKSPLLDRGQLLEKARNVLVHICGGTNLTLFEIETLMRDLTKHVSEDAQILFGAATDERLADSLSVTIISSIGKAKSPHPVAGAQSTAVQPKLAGSPASTHTQAIPILSVQPRQVPQPPPSSVIAPPPTTTTIATSSVPVLRMTAELTPANPVKTVKLAPLAPPDDVEPESFSELAAPDAEPAVALKPETAVPEFVNELAVEETVVEEPLMAEAASEDVTLKEEVASDGAFDAVVAVEQTSEECEGDLADVSSREEEMEIETAEQFEEEAVPNGFVAEHEIESEPAIEETEAFVAEEPVPNAQEPEETEDKHPAVVARGRRKAAPMRPIEVQPPVPKAPVPARKFDLREILQRQRQTRLGHLRSGQADTTGGRAAPREPAPSRHAPPGRQGTDRTPDPSRVAPIRPIPAAQPPARTNSPFIPTKPPATRLPVAGGRAESRQATFDDRLAPAPAARSGRFEKVEPTVEEGEDLDIPTFLRKKK